MDEESFSKLFTLFETSVKKLAFDSIELSELDIDKNNYQEFRLSLGEKNEIYSIFQIMSLISTSDFKSVISNDDISRTMSNLLIKVRENPLLLDAIRQIIHPKPTEIFNDLLNNASLTYERGNQGNKFNRKFKHFCTYLYTKAGRKAYKSLELNASVPSISTCLQNIQENYGGVTIGKIYAKELKSFIERNNLPKIICVSEDATRIKAKVQYDPKTSEIIGVVLPNLSNGLPNHEVVKIKTPENAMYIAKNFPRANFVEIIMAKPLCDGKFFKI